MNQFYSAYGERIKQRIKNQRNTQKIRTIDRQNKRQRSRSRDRQGPAHKVNCSVSPEKTDSLKISDGNNTKILHSQRHSDTIQRVVEERSAGKLALNAQNQEQPNKQSRSRSISANDKEEIRGIQIDESLNEIVDIKNIDFLEDQLHRKGEPIIKKQDNIRRNQATEAISKGLEDNARQSYQKQNNIRQRLPRETLANKQLERGDIISSQDPIIIRRYPYQALLERIQQISHKTQ